jgi:hypothetical protein
VFGFTQFLMGPTESVGAPNQVHARVQRLQARSGMPTLVGQARQSFTEGSIEPFKKSRIERAPPIRELEQLLCLMKHTVSHLAGHLHDPLFQSIQEYDNDP